MWQVLNGGGGGGRSRFVVGEEVTVIGVVLVMLCGRES